MKLITKLSPLEKRLSKVLAECATVITEECYAAGEDEVKRHPVLRRHYKTLQRAEKSLAEIAEAAAQK